MPSTKRKKLLKQIPERKGLELDFEMKRLGNKILELKNIDKSFGSKVF
jgi:ATP-binding cassette subfamily F protein uup